MARCNVYFTMDLKALFGGGQPRLLGDNDNLSPTVPPTRILTYCRPSSSVQSPLLRVEIKETLADDGLVYHFGHGVFPVGAALSNGLKHIARLDLHQ